MPTYPSSSSSSGGRARPQPGDDVQERLIPFPSSARSTGEPERVPRRRRDAHEQDRSANRPVDRTSSRPRRARRRRHDTPWLQRNALSVAAVSVLVALLGLGFGLLQMIVRPEPSPALLSLGQAEPSVSAGGSLNAGAVGPVSGPAFQIGPVGGASPAAPLTAADRPRTIQVTARPIEPNYTVKSGDTLGQIATSFNTTVERIQALNNLPDPRALRIGTRLVIPPPF